jgi:hypothetical protein
MWSLASFRHVRNLAQPFARARWFLLIGITSLFFLLGAAISPKSSLVIGDFTPHGTQPGLLTGIEGPLNCFDCHDGINTTDQKHMPYTPWAGSIMANAARDPLFFAALDVANRDVPGIGDYCLRCHAPNAWLQGRVRKDGAGGFVAGTNGCQMIGDYVSNDGKTNDYSGIGCHFCHRVRETGPTGQLPITYNANVWFDDVLDCNGQFGPCRHGPYTYPGAPGTVTNPPPHGWKQDPYFNKSSFCGTCHTVDSPDTDVGPAQTLILNNGTNTGIAFPLDHTYGEWLASDFNTVLLRSGFEDPPAGAPTSLAKGQSCQDCHMTNATDPAARACTFTAVGSRTNNLPVHEFAGSNYWMVGVLKNTYGAPTLLDREAAYTQTSNWIINNLTTKSAQVGVTLDPLPAGNATLTARIKVTNLTGHKLPNGYAEGRRMWLNVVARDANNNVVFESGAYNLTTGDLTLDAQVKVYESQQGIWQRFGVANQCVVQDPSTSRKHFNLALNNCIRRDNRIPPLGFTGANDPTIAPVGYTYPETAPGSGRLVNFDTSTYSMAIAASAVRPITVTATLKYQVASKDYITFLRDEAVLGSIPSENAMCSRTWTNGPGVKTRGQFMFDLWTANGKAAPLDMQTVQAPSTNSLPGPKP